MLDLVRQMAEATDLPIVAFPTPGLPQLVKGQIVYDTDPEYFAKAALRLAEEGATVLGGCCGTTPAHIRALRALLAAKPPKARARGGTVRERAEKKPLPTTEPSELAQKIGRRFVTAVEMDVPRGLNLDKLVGGARALKIAGADVINISDGARARLRMNPAAVAQIVQSRVGIEVTMHFACRDRNLLAIQSDLLGWHALGLRNILAVTGDPGQHRRLSERHERVRHRRDRPVPRPRPLQRGDRPRGLRRGRAVRLHHRLRLQPRRDGPRRGARPPEAEGRRGRAARLHPARVRRRDRRDGPPPTAPPSASPSSWASSR